MTWLKHPVDHFDERPYLDQGLSFRTGICVGDIQAKSGLAQSVISSYLLTMQKPACWNLNESESGPITEGMKNKLKPLLTMFSTSYNHERRAFLF